MTTTLETTVENTIEILNERINKAQADIRQAQAEIFKVTPKLTDEQQAVVKATLKGLRKQKYQTKNGLTVYGLRQAGCEVAVFHIRYTTTYTSQGTPVRLPINSFVRGAYDFDAKGGATHILIRDKNDETYAVSSICHEYDAFDYKLGVAKALDIFTQEEADKLLGK